MDQNAIIEEFEVLTRNAGKVQREILEKILQENGEIEYLKKCGLDGRTDPDNFKARVPIVTHSDLEPYIQQISDGTNPCALTRKPITRLTLRDYPLGKGKTLQLVYCSKQFKTKGGISAGTVTSNTYSSPVFAKVMEQLEILWCTPTVVIFGPDYHQAIYCHLLCGLLFWDQIQLVYSTFANTIVNAFRTFELVWEDLVEDIRRGTLRGRVTAPSIRDAMSKLLGEPNPNMVDVICIKVAGLRSSNWHGVIRELFPNAKYVQGVMTGSMAAYVSKLRHYAGELPLVSGDYVASEGWLGVNVNPKLPPESATFALIPNSCYFEFIPLKDEGASAIPVGLTEVNVGEEYEIVITNSAGLYRYRLEDVVKVEGFHNCTPEIKFVRRRNLILNINVDKNTEKDLELAVEAGAKLLAAQSFEVVDFTSHVDSSTELAHYVIFWEIRGDPGDELLQECCNCLDRAFVDAGYTSSRKVNAIGPLELRIVKSGTFQKMLDYYVGLGVAGTQIKMPRCVGPTNKTVLQILSVNAVKSYFSTAF